MIKYIRIGWTGYVSRMEEEWKGIPLGRPRSGLGGNIRVNFKEIGINPRSGVHPAQNGDYWRVFVNTALNLWYQ